MAVQDRSDKATIEARANMATTHAMANAITATPFVLGGLAGLAIWKMAGRRVPTVPTMVCFSFWYLNDKEG